MKAVLTDEEARIYAEPFADSISTTTIHKGDEFELGKVIRKRKEVWVAITLDSGHSGYIPGNTKIFAIKRVQVLKDNLNIHEAPDEESRILKTLEKKEEFVVAGVEKMEGLDWVRVRHDSGIRGFIKGDAKIRVVQEITRESARKQIITGAVFAGIGVVIFAVSMFQPQGSGDSTFIMLGLLAIGGFQVVQGIWQFRKLKEKEN